MQDQRLLLCQEFEASELSRAEICRRYGVSRKTGYKWFERYLADGVAGLGDESRRPHHQPRAVDRETAEEILRLRDERPSWGERKLRAWLEQRRPERDWPCASTIGAVLKRHGFTRPSKRRRKATPSPNLVEPNGSNHVWAIDFKGWFLTGDGRRCDPLTVSDSHSRYLLCCQALDQTGGKFVRGLLEALFREHGLPQRMRSDNGAPFATTGVGGLSRLSVWWTRLGIVHERIEPGHPEQNGRHERMHRTLKQETATPPACSGRAQQRLFDRFRREYNEERPHEALGMATPGSCYTRSPRPFPDKLPELEYPAGFALRKVEQHGDISWRFGRTFLGEALAGETVGLEDLEDGWRIWFGPLPLAVLDARQIAAAKRKSKRRRADRWRLEFLDGSGRPTGSRRRPKTKTRRANNTKPSRKDNH